MKCPVCGYTDEPAVCPLCEKPVEKTEVYDVLPNGACMHVACVAARNEALNAPPPAPEEEAPPAPEE